MRALPVAINAHRGCGGRRGSSPGRRWLSSGRLVQPPARPAGRRPGGGNVQQDPALLRQPAQLLLVAGDSYPVFSRIARKRAAPQRCPRGPALCPGPVRRDGRCSRPPATVPCCHGGRSCTSPGAASSTRKTAGRPSRTSWDSGAGCRRGGSRRQRCCAAPRGTPQSCRLMPCDDGIGPVVWPLLAKLDMREGGHAFAFPPSGGRPRYPSVEHRGRPTIRRVGSSLLFARPGSRTLPRWRASMCDVGRRRIGGSSRMRCSMIRASWLLGSGSGLLR